MSIVFAPFVGTNGSGIAVLPPLGAFGFTSQWNNANLGPLTAEGVGHAYTSGIAALEPLAAFGFDGKWGSATLEPLKAYGSAFAPPPYAVGMVLMPQFSVQGGGHFDLHGTSDVSLSPLGALGFNGQWNSTQLGPLRASNPPNPFLGDFLVAYQSPGYLELVTEEDATHKFVFDSIAFSATSPSAQAVLALLDSIAFHGQVTQQVNLHALIAAQIAFGDVSFGAPLGDLTDAVHFSDDNVALALYLATLLDSFAVSAELTGSAAIFAFLSDSFEFDVSLSVQQQIIQALQDGIEFGITLYTGADTYTAWVMTPETRAMRSYSNFAFNSYAQFGGRLFGAKDDGVYVLEGDTDAGQAIAASVRTGLLDFGSRQLKRVERAYLGYTAKGTLALRVTTTSPEGEKVDYTYRMVTPPLSDAPRETRIVVGKGLQSVYWAFELDNSLDGADFELHDMAVLPIILSRKVR